ncbi:MAG: hypothetical protein JJU34_03985 [Lunatimonas sp.]|uniref:hypothetical protein n=1 Tax=Lunatimonas sp. TaxID=2060141 RepID=UPI00263B2CB1|nr:hypothetical protein [Lunatimonas sp.]MCC5936417.1 hypothetical protein [Lunatimonas sp.]
MNLTTPTPQDYTLYKYGTKGAAGDGTKGPVDERDLSLGPPCERLAVRKYAPTDKFSTGRRREYTIFRPSFGHLPTEKTSKDT